MGRPNCSRWRAVLVRARGAAGGHPGHPGPGHPQHRRRIAETPSALQPMRLRHPHPVQGDVRVLHHPQGDLVAHLDRREAGRALLDHEPLDLLVLKRPGPDHHVVGERRVADPLLLPVQHPIVAVAAGGGGQPARGARPDVGLGEAERPDLLQPRHLRQPALLLLLRPAQVDGSHGQAAVHAEERGDGRVDPGQLHGDHAVEQVAAARAAVPGVGLPRDAELPQAGHHEVVGEFLPGPVVVDHRLDRLLHELPGPGQQLAALKVEGPLDQVEVAVGHGGPGHNNPLIAITARSGRRPRWAPARPPRLSARGGRRGRRAAAISG